MKLLQTIDDQGKGAGGTEGRNSPGAATCRERQEKRKETTGNAENRLPSKSYASGLRKSPDRELRQFAKGKSGGGPAWSQRWGSLREALGAYSAAEREPQQGTQ